MNELPTIDPIRLEQLYSLRDELNIQSFPQVEDSIAFVVATLRTILSAGPYPGIVIAGRTAIDESDVAKGWRPVWLHTPGRPMITKLSRYWAPKLRWSKKDAEGFAHAGSFRATTRSLDDPAIGRGHRKFNELLGIGHRLSGVAPITDNIELYVLMSRPPTGRAFEQGQRDTMLHALKLLQPNFYQWCRMIGTLDGVVLAPRERQVLKLLLEGHSEKACAQIVGIKHNYLHQIVVRIYKKFDVDSRPSLMAKCSHLQQKQSALWTSTALPIGQHESAPPRENALALDHSATET